MKRLVILLGVVGAVGCGKGSGGEAPKNDVDAGPFIAGFNPGPPPDGYTRFITPPIAQVKPQDGTLWCQWIAPPADKDQNVVDVKGEQSKYGHHVVLYATTANEPVGTTRPCTSDDMVTVRYLGGIGGEGTGSLDELPQGIVLRLPKGQALMANVHFLNLSDEDVQGQAVLDVKFDAPNPNERVAGFFNNTALNLDLPANTTTSLDRTCTVGSDLDFFMFSNHMHNYGTSVVTTVDRANDGGSEDVVHDDVWDTEEQFNPNWRRWSVAEPFALHTGDVLHTRCTWNNTSSGALGFPNEMCVGVGFFLPPGTADAQDIYCVEGQWSVGTPP